MIKIERTPLEAEKLAELRSSGTHNHDFIREQLRKDFHNKCYICGRSITGEFEIEHLLPHYNGTKKDRQLDWDNLFMSCSNCNGIKKNRYDGELLDCCREAPEMLICQKIDRGRVIAFARKTAPDQLRAKKTAQLITECFNYTGNSQAAENCTEKRRELKLRAIDLIKKLRRYREMRDNHEQYTDEQINDAKNDVKNMIDITSEYAGFMRTFVRERLDMFPEFTEVVGADPEKEGSIGEP